MSGIPQKITATFLGISDKFMTGTAYNLIVTEVGGRFLVHHDRPGNIIPYVEEIYTAKEYFINWNIIQ